MSEDSGTLGAVVVDKAIIGWVATFISRRVDGVPIVPEVQSWRPTMAAARRAVEERARAFVSAQRRREERARVFPSEL